MHKAVYQLVVLDLPLNAAVPPLWDPGAFIHPAPKVVQSQDAVPKQFIN